MTSVVPIGPFHPAMKEPEHFRVEVEGERVVNLVIKVGYNHRGMEKTATTRSYHRNIFLFERVCGICNAAHSLCYCQTVERLFDIHVPDRARYIRTVVAELNRIHSHLLWFGVAMHLIGYDTLFMHAWKGREYVMDAIEAATGNRVNTAMNTIGGVRRDITPKMADFILRMMDESEKATDYLVKAIQRDSVVAARVAGIGILTKEDAIRYSVVGPTLRASGIESDVRADDPYAAYGDVEWEVCVEDTCDVLARVLVRLRETLESIKIVRECLRDMPEGPIVSEDVKEAFPSEAFGRVEAPRGELAYYIRSNSTNIPERVKVRTPSFMNIPAIVPMAVGENLADVPIIIGSVDPCYACTDRVLVVDIRTGRRKTYTLRELARRGGR